MAGEGRAYFRVAGQDMAHLNLPNGAANQTFVIRFYAAVDMPGTSGSSYSAVQVTLPVGHNFNPSMFFDSLGKSGGGASAMSVSRVPASVTAQSVSYNRGSGACGNSTTEDGCFTLLFKITGGKLAAGDYVEFTYTGRTPLLSNRWAYNGSWPVKVESKLQADGDTAPITGDTPTFSVPGGSLAKLFVHIPLDIAWLGSGSEPFDVAVVALDQMGQVAGGPYAGTVTITPSCAMSGLPASYTFTAADDGIKIFEGVTTTELPASGAAWVSAADQTIDSISAPAKVAASPAWRRKAGCLHMHCGDGDDHMGRYVQFSQQHASCKNVWRMDFGAMTDHDFSADGMKQAARQASQAAALKELNDGRYAAFFGYEYTYDVDGYAARRNHHNAIEFNDLIPAGSRVIGHDDAGFGGGDDGGAFVKVGPALAQLGPVIFMPHLHRVDNDNWSLWGVEANPYRRLLEWGSNKNCNITSANMHDLNPSYDTFPINYTWPSGQAFEVYPMTFERWMATNGTSLRAGWEQGFICGVYGSTDEHNGCSGIRDWPFLAGTPGLHGEAKHEVGGATFALTTGPTRADIWNALINRRTYASTGARTWLDFQVDGHLMGEALGYWALSDPFSIAIDVIGEGADLSYVRLFRFQAGGSWQVYDTSSGWVADTGNNGGWSPAARTFSVALSGQARPSAYSVYYVRVKQADNHHACTSPVFVLDR